MKNTIQKFIEKNHVKCIFIIMLILQILTIIYLANQKVRLHMDEYLSYGFISSEKMYVIENDNYYNNWHSPDYFKEYLTIDDDEKNDFSPVYENQRKDVHPPFYYFLLRIFNNFNVGNFSIWPSIILNIVLFILTMCVVYLISMKLFNNKYYSLLVCFAFGFTFGVLEIPIFIRMYQLLILMSGLLIYWHLCNKDKTNLKILDLLQLFVIVVLGFLTHYYFAIVAVALYMVNFIRCIKNKNWKVLIKYTITLIFTVGMATLIFPYWLKHVFASGRGQEAIGLFSTVFDRITWAFGLFFEALNRDGFNYSLYVILGIMLILISINLYIKFKKKEKIKFSNSGMIYLVFLSIMYFVGIVCVAPYIELRYLSPLLMPIVIMIIYYLKSFLENIIKNKKYVFLIITTCFIVISIYNLANLNTNKNIFLFKDEQLLTEDIKKDADEKYLIYISNNLSLSFYNSYNIFLTYKETNPVIYDDKIVENLEKIIADKNLNNNDYVIAIDALIFREAKQKILENEQFKNLEFYGKVGESGLYKVKDFQN